MHIIVVSEVTILSAVRFHFTQSTWTKVCIT